MVLGITEALVRHDSDMSELNVDGYNTYVADTINNRELNYSRTMVFISKQLTVRVRHDLMSDDVSSIWLELDRANQKKFLVCGIENIFQQSTS